jgi:GcrA cell cycle regulator
MSLAEHDRPEFVGAALRRKRMVWTEAKDARLKELCAQGVPYDLMATDLSIEFEESIGRESVKDRVWKLRLRRTPLSPWTPEIDADMLKLTSTGTTYHEAALILNAKYGTAFTRNSLIGRASRLGGFTPRPKLTPEEREARRLAREARHNAKRRQARQAHGVKPRRVTPKPEREITVLRCAGIEPLNISLFDLTSKTCRWPYGEGPYTFCGHHPSEGSPYCAPHFHLSLRPAS